MKNGIRHRAGFTLVEVVVATMVVGVGIAGIMSMVLWMVRANDWSGDLSDASTLGQDLLEELLETPYASLADGSDTVGSYRRTWQVDSSASDTFKTIQVEVEWTRLDDKASRVTLASLRSNPVVPGVGLWPLNLDDVGGGGGSE